MNNAEQKTVFFFERERVVRAVVRGRWFLVWRGSKSCGPY